MGERNQPPEESFGPRSLGDRVTNVDPAGTKADGPVDRFGGPESRDLRGARRLAEGAMLGGFRVERRLGRGAMGEVWKAYDTVGERHVVVKVLPAELQDSADEMARVKHSFHHVQGLQHQHICPVYLLGEERDLGYYLVMRFVEGVTLAAFHRDQITKYGAMPLETVRRFLEPVALALDYAHAHKVVHRDIKPQNIMVSDEGRDVQVVDFGLAAEIRTSVSRVSRVHMDSSGTYPYMAPEQWRGEYQDGAADQYALGVVAFELMTDRFPYVAPDDFVLRQCVLHEPVPEIDGQPAYVNNALKRALAKKRDERFENCAAFIQALGSSQPASQTPKKHVEKLELIKLPADKQRTDKSPEELPTALEAGQRRLAERGLDVSLLSKHTPVAKPALDVSLLEQQQRIAGSIARIIETPKVQAKKPPPHDVRPAPPPEPVGEVRRFEGHTDPVNSVCFSPDGQKVLSAGSDRQVRLWNAQTGAWISRYTEPRCEAASAAFTPDGRRVMSGAGFRPQSPSTAESSEGVVRLYDVASWQELRRFDGHKELVRGVAFSPDGRLALTGSIDQTMRLWDVETGREVRVFKHGGWLSECKVLSVAYAPNGQFVVSGNNDRTIRLWDVNTGQEVRRFLGHEHTIPCIVFSPDGRRLLSAGCEDNTVRLWDVATGQELRRFTGTTGKVWSVAFTPDGRRALSGSGFIRKFGFMWLKQEAIDCTVRLWDVETGVVLHRFEGHTTGVASVACSPDGRYALSGAGVRHLSPGAAIDTALRMWRMPS